MRSRWYVVVEALAVLIELAGRAKLVLLPPQVANVLNEPTLGSFLGHPRQTAAA
jgi:hypothetical protein